MDKILRSTSVSGVRRLNYRIEADANKSAAVSQPVAAPTLKNDGPENESFSRDFFTPAEETARPDPHLLELAELHQTIERYQKQVDYLERQRDVTQQQFDELRNASIKEGYDEGYAKGEAQGKADIHDQISATLKNFKELLSRIDTQSEEAWRPLETMVGDLSFAVVCKLLGEHALDESTTRAMVEKVVSSTRDSVRLRVLLSPKDFRLLTTADPDLRLSSGRRVELIEDVRVELGGCIVETDFGTWDGRLENQLKLLKIAVDDAIELQLNQVSDD